MNPDRQMTLRTRKLRGQAQRDYQRLPLDQRKELTAAYKIERESNPKLDWTSWVWRQLSARAGSPERRAEP
jgi:hypothetical protein